MIKPIMFNDEEGNLYIRVELDEFSDTKLVPPFNVPEDFHEWVRSVVPGMVDEVYNRLRAKGVNELFKRNEALKNIKDEHDAKSERKEQRRHASRNHLRAVK